MPSIYRPVLSIHFFSKNTIGVDSNYVDTWLGVPTWRGVDTWPVTPLTVPFFFFGKMYCFFTLMVFLFVLMHSVLYFFLCMSPNNFFICTTRPPDD